MSTLRLSIQHGVAHQGGGGGGVFMSFPRRRGPLAHALLLGLLAQKPEATSAGTREGGVKSSRWAGP